MLCNLGLEPHFSNCVVQINWKAVIYASVVTIEDIVFGTEVQFLVDEHGGKFASQFSS